MLGLNKGILVSEDRTEKEIRYMVAVTVPSGMTDEEVERALLTCIGFGRPCITKLCEVPAPRKVQTISATL